MIRRAKLTDLDAVERLYAHIHDEEEAGRKIVGWDRTTYPVRATAEAALQRGDLYVMEENGAIIASALINQIQVPEYANARWKVEAGADEVLVLHTLVVEPSMSGRGCATRFVAFYEQMARRQKIKSLRMDTNERNIAARTLYARLGYHEADIVDCVFNGLPGVRLVCLEKAINL